MKQEGQPLTAEEREGVKRVRKQICRALKTSIPPRAVDDTNRVRANLKEALERTSQTVERADTVRRNLERTLASYETSGEPETIPLFSVSIGRHRFGLEIGKVR